MNIVHIEDFFHPNAGYQINILPKYMVAAGHDVTIVTSQMELIPENITTFFGREHIDEYDKLYTKETGVKVVRLPLKKYISGRAVFGKELDEKIKCLNPDVVYVHGNDTVTGIKYISKLGKLNFALVTDSHMLEMASVNKFRKLFRKFYKTFITPKIIKYRLPVIRTQDDNYVEKCLGIPIAQSPWISYGSDTLLFYPDKEEKAKFRKDHGINDNAFVVVYAGKLDESKGGKLLAETFHDFFKTKKQVVLLVVGNTSGEYGREVDKIFSESQNIIFRFPTQKYTQLPKFYQAADLSVFASQCSLSFYDAQACGLPVISENNNINIDRCSHSNGFTFLKGNYQDFRAKIQLCIDMDELIFQRMKNNSYQFILENYNYANKANEYLKILEEEKLRFVNRGK